MFADELEHIDRTLNYPEILRNRRLRAWYEFRDRSEPLERIGHTDPPFQSVLAIEPEVEYLTCSTWGRRFLTTSQRDHHATVAHRSKRAHAEPVAVDPVILARRVAAQDEIARRPVIIDGCNVDELIAAMEGRAA